MDPLQAIPSVRSVGRRRSVRYMLPHGAAAPAEELPVIEGVPSLSQEPAAPGDAGVVPAVAARSRRMSACEERRASEVSVVHKLAAIEAGFVLRRLKEKINTMSLLQELMLYIPFLIMFIFFFLLGRANESTFYMAESSRNLVVGNEFPHIPVLRHYEDIVNSDDWYQWVTNEVLENVWATDDTSDSTTQPTRYGQGQNLFLGAIRLRALRVTDHSCTVNDHVVTGNFSSACFGKYSRGNEDKAEYGSNATDGLRFRWTDPSSLSGITTMGLISSYHPGGYMVSINVSDSMATAHSTMVKLKEAGFVDDIRTRFVVLQFFVYLPQLDSYVWGNLYTEVSAGGAWLPHTEFRVFQYWTSQSRGQTIFNFFFFGVVAFFLARWLWRLFAAYRNPDDRVYSFLTSFWNVFELANLLCFVVNFGFHWAWWRKCQALSKEFPYFGRYPAVLEEVAWLYLGQSYAGAFNTVLTFVQAMKYAALNPRLGLILRVLRRCQSSIVGLLAIFVWLVFAYTVAGCGLYAAGLRAYFDLSTAYSTLVRMLLGDFDYNEMWLENRWLTPLFFWSFVILSLFLVLNFIIGILADGFEKEKEAIPLDEDEEFVDALASVVDFFRPRNILMRIKLFLRCKSEVEVLQGAARRLARKLEEERAEDD
eukprot:RCo050132